MAKSIKLKDNTYLDASGVTYSRNTIDKFMALMQVPDTNNDYGALGDGGTKTYAVRNFGVYLYINSHAYRRCVILITHLSSSNMSTDVIFKSDNAAIPSSITNNGSTITINAFAGGCRGYLYDVTRQICG